MKRALVLSGGGCKGAFEVGALDYLIREQDYDFEIFLGTSVGALNVGFLGQACNKEEMKHYMAELMNFWMGIKGDSEIYDKSIFGNMRLLWKDCLFEPTGLRRILYEKIDLCRLCDDPNKIVMVTVVALETGELYYADTRSAVARKDYIEYILASACMPLFFPAIPIQGKRWYDGGLRDITPLKEIYKMEPDEIVIITTYPLDEELLPVYVPENPKGPLPIMSRVFDIILGEVGANDLQITKLLNHCRKPGEKPIPIKLITPESPIPGKDGLDFTPSKIKQNIERGYKAAHHMRQIV